MYKQLVLPSLVFFYSDIFKAASLDYKDLVDQYRSLDPDEKAKYGEGHGGCKKESAPDPDKMVQFKRYCSTMSLTASRFDRRFGFKSIFAASHEKLKTPLYASGRF